MIQVDFNNAAAQNLFGNGGHDRMVSGCGQSTLSGGDGNDALTSYNGRSHLNGGAADDTLYPTSSYSMAGNRAAVLIGGAGHDTLSLSLTTITEAFVANFALQNVVLVGGTRISGVEAVGFWAGSGNDSLTASNDAAVFGVNTLGGNGGNDTLRASAAGVRLDGGTGNDLPVGAAGADHQNGSLNDDTLLGGYGKDVLTGGPGADNFVFAAYAQTGNDAVTRDRITDFGHTDLDRIDLSGIDLSGIDADGSFGNGKTAFHFIGNTVFHHAAGELFYAKFNPRAQRMTSPWLQAISTATAPPSSRSIWTDWLI